MSQEATAPVEPDVLPPPPSHTLPLPEEATNTAWSWPYLVGIVGYHLLALLAFWPALFSWLGVALAFAGLYVFGTLGINICYHRLLTHQSFKCPKWLEYSLAVLGVCCLQDTPARWVAIHRLHHQHSDKQPDPHSPLVSFLWGHVGWVIQENRFVNSLDFYYRYAPDVLKDRFYMKLEKKLLWLWINVVQMLVFFAFGLLVGGLWYGTWTGALWLAASVMVWGVFVRTVLVWHITWSVNSITHIWGYQTYPTRDNSKNNWFVGLVSNGEGWHNNHHAHPRSAAHGHAWYELDVSWITIWIWQKLGLAWDVVLWETKDKNPATE